MFHTPYIPATESRLPGERKNEIEGRRRKKEKMQYISI